MSNIENHHIADVVPTTVDVSDKQFTRKGTSQLKKKYSRKKTEENVGRKPILPLQVAIASPYQSKSHRKTTTREAVAVSTAAISNQELHTGDEQTIPPPPVLPPTYTSKFQKSERKMYQKIDSPSVTSALSSNEAYRQVAVVRDYNQSVPRPPVESCQLNSKPEQKKKSGTYSFNDEIDFNLDDEVYMIVASNVIDLLYDFETHSSYDPVLMEKVLPKSIQVGFINAVRYRMDLLPTKPDKNEPRAGYMTRKCHSLGLGSSDEKINPILNRESKPQGSYFPTKNRSSMLQGIDSNEGKVESTKYIEEYSNEASKTTGIHRKSKESDQQIQEKRKENQQIQHMQQQQEHFSQSHQTAKIMNDYNNLQEQNQKQEEADITTKIREASDLMVKSNTKQAASFWKNQVIHLQERLKSIKSKCARKKDKKISSGVYSSSSSPSSDIENPMVAESQCDYVSMKEESKMAHSVSQGKNTDSTNSTNKAGNFRSELFKHKEFAKTFQQHMENDLRIVNVISPADLPEGFTFEAIMGKDKFLALVPIGGIKKGEIFSTPMVSLNTIQIPVPIGSWRDDICHCLAHGPCHPLLFCSMFFPQIGLGQIMTRTQLNWLGHAGSKSETKNTCISTLLVYISWVLLNMFSLYVIIFENWYKRSLPPGTVDLITIGILNGTFLIYTIYAVATARWNIRMKYAIEESTCVGCEDCCCATWCSCCSIAQMGRHTGNFETIRGVFWSKTGIPKHVGVNQGLESGTVTSINGIMDDDDGFVRMK